MNLDEQNINSNKNKTKLKMRNPTHSFREMNLVPQFIQESLFKNKTVMSWNSRKKKLYRGYFLYRLFRPKGIF